MRGRERPTGACRDDRLVGQPGRASTALKDTIPMGRAGLPEEVAQAVVWLCSDEASFVTGRSWTWLAAADVEDGVFDAQGDGVRSSTVRAAKDGLGG